VTDGYVAKVEGLDDAGRAFVDQYGRNEVPTIADLRDEVETASRRGADVVDVQVADDGCPAYIAIDYEAEAYVDEACYLISETTDRR
jgi:hypothetical protein